MGYLICEDCGGYYELQNGESPKDFDACHCGGKLKYYNKLNDFFEENKLQNVSKNETEELLLVQSLIREMDDEEKHKREEERKNRLEREKNYQRNHEINENKGKMKTHVNNYESIVAKELVGNDFHREKWELNKDLELYQDIKHNSKIDPQKSEKYIIDTGFTALAFSIALFSYGIAYNFWYADIMAVLAVLFASFTYLTSKNEKISEPGFMQNIFIGSGLFFILICAVILLFVASNFTQFGEFRRSGFYFISFVIITALVALYCGIEMFMSYTTPNSPFNPRSADKSKVLGTILKDQISAFDLILVLVLFSIVISTTHLMFKLI